jgi:hypothetical protein
VLAVAALVAAALPAGAGASNIFGDVGVQNVKLKVNRDGIALVEYTAPGRGRRHVLVWGAVNALPNSDAGSRQVAFQFDYSGGWKSKKDARYWQKLRNACGRYAGPRLPFFLAGCTAPDGSHWALQRWQRNLPMRGFDPWTDRQKAFELHISHWSGDLPELEIHQSWTYGGAQEGFFGRLMYDAKPVYGTRSPSARVSDPFARNIYIATFNSDYGRGWKHDTAINTHPVNGAFCYTFVPQAPPAGYPSKQPNGNGRGERYRVSVMGPGVTPVIQWEERRIGRFDAAVYAEKVKLFDAMLAGDRHCARER